MRRFFKSMGLAFLYFAGYLALMALFSVTVREAFLLVKQWPEGMPRAGIALEAYEQWIGGAYHFVNVAGNVLVALCIWGVCKLRGKRLGAALAFRPMPARVWLLCAAAGMSIAATAAILLSLMLPESWLRAYAMQSETLITGPMGIRLFAIMVSAPLVEEMLFRGLIYDALRAGMARTAAIAFSALAFGLPHAQPVWIAYAAILGVMMSLIRDACASLWAAVAFHAAFNFMGSFLLPALQMTGMQGLLILAFSVILCIRLGVALGITKDRMSS